MTTTAPNFEHLDHAVADLDAASLSWARTSVDDRIDILEQIKAALIEVSQTWVDLAAKHKQLPPNSPLVGEEWLSGPYGMMAACNGLRQTLSQIEGKAFLAPLKKRKTSTGQLAVSVVPSSVWDRILLSGISAEVWMQPSVTAENLSKYSASAYDIAPKDRHGVVSLVLGAGNIASIAPLDCFQKLFLENQTVVLKLNPVNDYLLPVLLIALKPLIDLNALRIVTGDGDVGAYLCNHADIDEIHITGAQATHDLIVWGAGEEGINAKKAGKPVNSRRMTSELGAVCPTIVVPGPWSKADIDFQAQNIATHKLHNSGFNCVACQVLVMPSTWEQSAPLFTKIKEYISTSHRPAYYPFAHQRLQQFEDNGSVTKVDRGSAPAALIHKIEDGDHWFETNETFAPALATYELDHTDPEAYLIAAIDYANTRLHGTLGGNIIIHPKTIRQIGQKRFDQIIAQFKYGCIAINAWTGVGFMLTKTPWGAFPGHSLNDVQSGIGTVHNTFMFDRPERTIVQQPWRPFPRNILSGHFALLPKPPWFITNKRQHVLGKLLTEFEYQPSWKKLPRIMWHALRG